jgi:hypothetical protein
MGPLAVTCLSGYALVWAWQYSTGWIRGALR